MATSKLSASENVYHNFMSEKDNTEGCWSKICWLLAQLYHYTIGSCCYTPLRCIIAIYRIVQNLTVENFDEFDEWLVIHQSFPLKTFIS